MTDEQQTDDLYELVKRVKAKMSLLELVSHGKTGAYDSDGGRGAPDSKPPGGGVGKADDFQIDFPQKSHLAFRAQYERIVKDLQTLEGQIKETLEAWRRTPPLTEPEFGTFEWKRWVGASTLSVGEIARKFSCSRQYVIQIQHEYSTEESRQARRRRVPGKLPGVLLGLDDPEQLKRILEATVHPPNLARIDSEDAKSSDESEEEERQPPRGYEGDILDKPSK